MTLLRPAVSSALGWYFSTLWLGVLSCQDDWPFASWAVGIIGTLAGLYALRVNLKGRL